LLGLNRVSYDLIVNALVTSVFASIMVYLGFYNPAILIL